ncbi:MAG: hypothetical protein MUC97_15685 [Bernardetiaceae bacterium]|nr:hypothetical protein [Bernardetiaceae bacterium]
MHRRLLTGFLGILFIVLATTACMRPITGSRPILPPGQAKKISGSKSAKPYAPGQQNKQR